jgi:Zn-dependent protease with chaperone function
MENSDSIPLDWSILSEFKTKIKPARASLLYICGMFLVMLAMITLPVIYFALVGGLAYLVCYHAVHNWGPIMGWGDITGGFYILIIKFMIYFTPVFVGGIIVFFLFKPILARRTTNTQPLALNPATEPLLYAFIDKICDTIGAPSPKRIDLNCDLNAGAFFRRGFLSFFSSDFGLVIGLPLMANLNASEFAGVIAHEFGHLTQGAGMRLNYIIRTINMWFARVVYERDAWDVALENWSMQENDWRIMLMLVAAQLGVGLSRFLLKILMYTGAIIGGFMTRQMEYNADQCAIKVSGSAAVESFHRKTATLEAVMQNNFKEMRANWKKYHTLPDNLPETIRQRHEKMPKKVFDEINDTLGLRTSGIFDSHPSPGDRIRRARLAGDPGVFQDIRPASDLFNDFQNPARFVTMIYYTNELGIRVLPQMLTPVVISRPDPKASTPAGTPGDSLLSNYFLGAQSIVFPLRLPDITASSDWEADIRELQQIVGGLVQIGGQITNAMADYRAATDRRDNARVGICLMANGMTYDPALFGGTEATMEAATLAEKEAFAAQRATKESLREVIRVLHRRIELGISLALSSVSGNTGPGVTPEKIMALLTELRAMEAEYPQQEEILSELHILNLVLNSGDVRGKTPAWARSVERQAKAVLALRLDTPPESVQPAEEKPATLKLKSTAKAAGFEGAQELEKAGNATAEWHNKHLQCVEALVQIAHSMEESFKP